MATQPPVLETLVSSLIKQAPTDGVQGMIDTLLHKDHNPDADLPRGILAGMIGGVAATLAKSLVERIFPITAPDPEKMRTLALGDQELQIQVDTREWVTGVLVGGAYGAAAELAPEVTMGNGLGLGSALYGINNAGELASPEKVEIKPREENESHELLSDMVYGLVAEFVRSTVRARLN